MVLVPTNSWSSNRVSAMGAIQIVPLGPFVNGTILTRVDLVFRPQTAVVGNTVQGTVVVAGTDSQTTANLRSGRPLIQRSDVTFGSQPGFEFPAGEPTVIAFSVAAGVRVQVGTRFVLVSFATTSGLGIVFGLFTTFVWELVDGVPERGGA